MVSAPLAVVVGAMLPQAGEHAVPFSIRVHVTPLVVASLVTVAVNCCVAAACRETPLGATETLTPSTVRTACPDAPLLATDVAVSVTCRLPANSVLGAV